MPELSVILVSYNDRSHLEDCLLSLQQLRPHLDMEIIVVDNSSQDGSRDLVKNQFPEVMLIENGENMGFGRANNQGVFQSTGEFILFLNMDTFVSAEAFGLLLDEMRTNPSVGGAGPALLSGSNRYQVSFGKKVDFFSECIQKGFYNPFYARKLKHDRKRREVGWLSAACLLVRKQALKEVGLFDENFFLYFEDIDLCYRIRSKGWQLVYLPQARMMHKGGTSTSKSKKLSRFHYRKSQIYFYKKHNSWFSIRILRAYLLLIFTFVFFFSGGQRDMAFPRARDYFRLLKKKSDEKN